MKDKEKKQARKLRRQGLSINEIYPKVGAAKSSVSLWVRDIELTAKQKQTLSKKGHLKEVVEKRRITRLTNENRRRQKIIDSSKKEIGTIYKQKLFLIGIALYWAEGKKTGNVVGFANSDPRLIQIMMRFFREVCLVPQHKLRGHINLHLHLPKARAEKYWLAVSGIPKKQFYNTSQQKNRGSKNKKDSLPYGTFSIYICNTKLLLKLKGWMEGVHEKLGK